MTALNRYHIEAGDGPGIYTDRDPEGEWVRASDAAELVAEIQQLKLQLEPRSVHDVVSFAYIETLSSQQIHELLTKIHERNQELQAVVNMTAEAFDGGPDHPWIPGFDAQKIYKAVMKNYAPPMTENPGRVCSCIRQPQEPQCTDCPQRQ